MKNPVFTGAGVAIITPMYEDGSVNFDELGRIIEDQIARGTDAIVMDDYTRKFSIVDDKDVEIYNILTTVYQALEEKGYNPINQIVGYILSEDPTYITNHMGARTLIRKLDRDELLQVLVKKYLGQ